MADPHPSSRRASLRILVAWPAPAHVTVSVGGEVDAATAPALRTELVDLIARQHPREVEVDLAATSFLDCAGVSALIAAYHAASAAGCQVRLTHPRPIVRLVLEMFGLLEPFHVEAQPLASAG